MPLVGPAPPTQIIAPTDAEEGQTRTVRNPGPAVVTVGKSSTISAAAADAFTIAVAGEERVTLEMGEAFFAVLANAVAPQQVDVL